jgi:hypothetical protein
MKEQAREALHELAKQMEEETEQEWKKGGWERLKSLTEAGIDPNVEIVEFLDDDNNPLARIYDETILEAGLSPEARVEVWATLKYFEGNLETVWWNQAEDDEVAGAFPKIQDFLGVKAKDLGGIPDLTPIRRRILEKLFSNPT